MRRFTAVLHRCVFRRNRFLCTFKPPLWRLLWNANFQLVYRQILFRSPPLVSLQLYRCHLWFSRKTCFFRLFANNRRHLLQSLRTFRIQFYQEFSLICKSTKKLSQNCSKLFFIAKFTLFVYFGAKYWRMQWWKIALLIKNLVDILKHWWN